jgi:signal transduction histidine kinase/CheY-like chemotaxis protein
MENLQVSALDEDHVNLDDLRQEIVRYLMISLIVLGLVLAWAALPEDPLNLLKLSLFLCLSLIGAAARLLYPRRPRAARHLLVWGCLAWLLPVIAVLHDPWAPFFSLLGILLGSVLVSGAEFAYAGATLALVLALNGRGATEYPTGAILLACVLSVLSAMLLRRTLFTALEWYWASRQRTEVLLKETREHRAEISRAYKSLELAYHIQQKIQDELVHANRRADEALQMKERFAANISHELRTPLNLILGFSEVMYKSPETYGEVYWPPILRRDVYQIYRSSEHLLEMIDDVLDLSRYEMLDFSLIKEFVPISKTVEEAVEIGRDLFAGSGIRLETNLAPDLPKVDIDVTRVRQILINLLKNARSFTAEGFVKISARLEEDHILLSVKDTGVGIPKEKQEAIFGEFYQVDQSRAAKRQGAGLGLAICKRLVEAHGGTIWVESAEGIGTEFFFTLPLPNQRYRYPNLETTELHQVLQTETRDCVLVVEADPVIVNIISRQLGDLEVVQVDDPARMEEVARRCHPCLVIDNSFRGKDRPSEIRFEEPVPVLQVSLPSQAWLAKELEISTSLIKPVTSARFLSLMSRYPEAHDILIVDDDREFCQLIHRYLQSSSQKYRVRFAYDGQEGWAALKEQPPDLVILDVIMPNMNGFEIIEQMKLDPLFAHTHIVLITGTHFDRDIQEKYESQIHITQQNGLSYKQTLGCIKALSGVFEVNDAM